MTLRGSTALLATRVILVLAGAVFVLVDLAGHGDSTGFDPKDLGFVVVGSLLAVAGASLRSRKVRRAA